MAPSYSSMQDLFPILRKDLDGTLARAQTIKMIYQQPWRSGLHSL